MAAFELPKPLSQRINAAAANHHKSLNQHITSLLPLCLSSSCSDPTKYVEGMSYILLIYDTMEEAFRSLRATPYNESNDNEQIVAALKALYIPQIERTHRLRSDLDILRHRFSFESSNVLEVMKRKHSILAIFIQHIKAAIATKFYILLAYNWTFYMALFSGGRYIRRKLKRAGPGFWSAQPAADHETNTMVSHEEVRGAKMILRELLDKKVLDEATYEEQTKKQNERRSNKCLLEDAEEKEEEALSFWHFEGDQDGEDIKADFKRRFASVEGYLNEEEKQEIVEEGVFVMESMHFIVQEIFMVSRRGLRFLDEEGGLLGYSGKPG